jgi:TPP-dependent pyruvate/acetoin dehydrogenase alpha subunit
MSGVLAHLDDQDAVAVDHRSTGPMVARGVDLTALMVEVMGGQTGLNAGWAGHMHLMDPQHGLPGTAAWAAAPPSRSAKRWLPRGCAPGPWRWLCSGRAL